MPLRLLQLRKLKKLESRTIRGTRVVMMTRVVKLRPRSILWTSIHFLYIFVYYTVMIGSEDQILDLSIWTDIHIYIYIFLVYLQMFFNVSAVYFYVKCVKCQSKI